MVQSIQASELSLREVTDQLNLQEVRSGNFFSEWKQDFLPITAFEQQQIDRVREDFHDQSQDFMLEQAVKLVAVAPMLSLAGFYRDPFQIRPEKSIQIILPSEDKILRGRIDVLVLAHQLWILVIESKEAGFSLKESIPQALIYMAATPTPDRPAYGLCTNGSHWLFLKLDVQSKQYARSNEFSLYREGNELGNVLQVLKQLGEIVRPIAKD
jgi:hypothetical protein